MQPDGKILVSGPMEGDYIPGDPDDSRYSLPLLRLNTDGSVDSGFTYDAANGPNVSAVAVQPDGKILVGYLTPYNDTNATTQGVRRLNADGSVDDSFNAADLPVKFVDSEGSSYGSIVNVFALQPDGKLIIGGGFDQVDGVAAHDLARLKADGTLDTTFANGNPVGSVNALDLLSNGKLLVGGETGLARLYAYASNAPQITGAANATATLGATYSYQITASNTPTSYAADRLPAGLSLDAIRGLITGVPSAAGTYPVSLQATNADGTDAAPLTITVELPVVTLTAPVPQVTAGSGAQGQFVLGLPTTLNQDVYVNLTIRGSAVNGTDYTLLKATKKIKAGETSKPIKVIPLGEGAGTGQKRSVVLLLAPGAGYTVGTPGKVKVRIYGR